MHEQGKTPSELAVILQRSLGTVCRQLAKKRPTKKGRPLALSPRQVDRLIATTEAMVEEADANYDVTLPMVLRRSRLGVSEKTAQGALHKKGYRFRRLRSKMILTQDDVKARYEWARLVTIIMCRLM